VWRDYSKISVFHQSNGNTCFCYTKKNKSFIMSPTVGDLFKSPTGNGAHVFHVKFKELNLIMKCILKCCCDPSEEHYLRICALIRDT